MNILKQKRKRTILINPDININEKLNLNKKKIMSKILFNQYKNSISNKDKLLNMIFNLDNTNENILKEIENKYNKEKNKQKIKGYNSSNENAKILLLKFLKDFIDNEIESFDLYKQKLEIYLNKLNYDYNFYNQPIDYKNNNELFYYSVIYEFIYNFIYINHNLMIKIYDDKDKMLYQKKFIIKKLFPYLKKYIEINDINKINYIVFLLISYQSIDNIINIENILNDNDDLVNIPKNYIDNNNSNDNDLIIKYFNNKTFKIENYRKYSIQALIKKLEKEGKFDKNLDLEFLKFKYIIKNNYYSEDIDTLKKILKEILGSKVIISYLEFYVNEFIPILKKKFNKDFYLLFLTKNFKNIWKKYIKFYPFFNNTIGGYTDKFTLNIIISSYPYFKKLINSTDQNILRLINYGFLFVVLLHEIIGHFYRAYFRYLLPYNEKYPLFTDDNNKEAGITFEKEVFGKKFNKVTFTDIIFILNNNNYDKNYIEFKNDYNKYCLDDKNIDIKLENLLKKYNIKFNNNSQKRYYGKIFAENNLLEDDDGITEPYVKFNEINYDCIV